MKHPWDRAQPDEWLPRSLRLCWGGGGDGGDGGGFTGDSGGGFDSGFSATTGGGDWGSAGSFDASGFNAPGDTNAFAGTAYDASTAGTGAGGGGDWGSFGATNYGGMNAPNAIFSDIAGPNPGVFTGGGDWGSAGAFSAAGMGGGPGGGMFGSIGGGFGGFGPSAGGGGLGPSGGGFTSTAGSLSNPFGESGYTSTGPAYASGSDETGVGAPGGPPSAEPAGGEPSGGPSDIGGDIGAGPGPPAAASAPEAAAEPSGGPSDIGGDIGAGPQDTTDAAPSEPESGGEPSGGPSDVGGDIGAGPQGGRAAAEPSGAEPAGGEPSGGPSDVGGDIGAGPHGSTSGVQEAIAGTSPYAGAFAGPDVMAGGRATALDDASLMQAAEAAMQNTDYGRAAAAIGPDWGSVFEGAAAPAAPDWGNVFEGAAAPAATYDTTLESGPPGAPTSTDNTYTIGGDPALSGYAVDTDALFEGAAPAFMPADMPATAGVAFGQNPFGGIGSYGYTGGFGGIGGPNALTGGPTNQDAGNTLGYETDTSGIPAAPGQSLYDTIAGWFTAPDPGTVGIVGRNQETAYPVTFPEDMPPPPEQQQPLPEVQVPLPEVQVTPDTPVTDPGTRGSVESFIPGGRATDWEYAGQPQAQPQQAQPGIQSFIPGGRETDFNYAGSQPQAQPQTPQVVTEIPNDPANIPPAQPGLPPPETPLPSPTPPQTPPQAKPGAPPQDIDERINEFPLQNHPMRGPAQALIVHETDTPARGTAADVANSWRGGVTGSHFVIDREGKITQLLPLDRTANHARSQNSNKSQARTGHKLGNENTYGVEVIGKNEKDILPVQREAVKALYEWLQGRGALPQGSSAIYGHGEIADPRSAKGSRPNSEGRTAVMIRNGDPLTSEASDRYAEKDTARQGGGPLPTQQARTGGEPGRSYVGDKVFSFYAPGAKSAVEGKFIGSKGNALKTLDDVRLGNSDFVTLAGHPGQFGQQVFVGDITYTSPIDSKQYTLTNVKGIVGDTGKDFGAGRHSSRNPNQNKFDIATGDFRGWGGSRGERFVGNNKVAASQGPPVTTARPQPPENIPPAPVQEAARPPPETPLPPVNIPAPFLAPPARGRADPAMLERSAENIFKAASKGLTKDTGVAEFAAASARGAAEMAKAGIPASIARSVSVASAIKGAIASGRGPNDWTWPAVVSTINSTIDAALQGYHPVAPGPVQGPYGFQPGAPAQPVAARAEGGPVEKGKPYVVGEQGPEYFVPDEPGTVVPSFHMPQPGEAAKTGRNIDRWPKVPAPEYPGRFGGYEREILRQMREAQNPVPAMMDLIDSGRLRFNDAAWESWLNDPAGVELGRSRIEDRRGLPPEAGGLPFGLVPY